MVTIWFARSQVFFLLICKVGGGILLLCLLCYLGDVVTFSFGCSVAGSSQPQELYRCDDILTELHLVGGGPDSSAGLVVPIARRGITEENRRWIGVRKKNWEYMA